MIQPFVEAIIHDMNNRQLLVAMAVDSFMRINRPFIVYTGVYYSTASGVPFVRPAICSFRLRFQMGILLVLGQF